MLIQKAVRRKMQNAVVIKIAAQESLARSVSAESQKSLVGCKFADFARFDAGADRRSWAEMLALFDEAFA